MEITGRKPLQIAILLYPGVTALDAVGPWEVLSWIPGTEIRFVGKEVVRPAFSRACPPPPIGTRWECFELWGAEPRPAERIVRSGKTVTAAGVSAGIDLALKLAKVMMDQRMPAGQRRLVPKIAWRRLIDFVRAGK